MMLQVPRLQQPKRQGVVVSCTTPSPPFLDLRLISILPFVAVPARRPSCMHRDTRRVHVWRMRASAGFLAHSGKNVVSFTFPTTLHSPCRVSARLCLLHQRPAHPLVLSLTLLSRALSLLREAPRSIIARCWSVQRVEETTAVLLSRPCRHRPTPLTRDGNRSTRPSAAAVAETAPTVPGQPGMRVRPTSSSALPRLLGDLTRAFPPSAPRQVPCLPTSSDCGSPRPGAAVSSSSKPSGSSIF